MHRANRQKESSSHWTNGRVEYLFYFGWTAPKSTIVHNVAIGLSFRLSKTSILWLQKGFSDYTAFARKNAIRNKIYCVRSVNGLVICKSNFARLWKIILYASFSTFLKCGRILFNVIWFRIRINKPLTNRKLFCKSFAFFTWNFMNMIFDESFRGFFFNCE